jgi:hypothetical protein
MSDNAGNRAVSKRKIRNFLLQPFLQVKLGLYSIGLAVVFGFLICGMLYLNLYRFYDMVIELTDLGPDVNAILDSYLKGASVWVLASLIVYLILTVGISVLYTHRLVGPTYAFRRHIRNLKNGNYSSRVMLRKHDAFAEVAEDLNELAEHLERGRK